MNRWNFPLAGLSYFFTLGAIRISTWITKPEAHAEDVAHLVNHAATYSRQRRQLRTGGLRAASL